MLLSNNTTKNDFRNEQVSISEEFPTITIKQNKEKQK